jgi:hypothetical protein
MTLKPVCALATILVTSGCYYYQPVARDVARPGTILSLALTDSGTSHFWPYLGPDVGIVRGRLLDKDDHEITLSVASVGLRHGQDLFWKGETVAVQQEFVAFVQERRLSTGRTILAASGSVAAFVALFVTLRHTGVGAGGPGTGGPPR